MNGSATRQREHDVWLTPTERQAAARDAYQRSIDEGTPLSAAALAAQFDRSPRWAQDRTAEVRRQRNTGWPLSNNRSAPATHAGITAERAADHAVENSRAQRLDTLVVVTVATVAAAASHQHQHTLAALAGEGWLAWALPISVDGMMLATGRSILRRRRAGIPAPFLSWFGFALGFVASVAANVAAAHPTIVGRLIAAWPPVAPPSGSTCRSKRCSAARRAGAVRADRSLVRAHDVWTAKLARSDRSDGVSSPSRRFVMPSPGPPRPTVRSHSRRLGSRGRAGRRGRLRGSRRR